MENAKEENPNSSGSSELESEPAPAALPDPRPDPPSRTPFTRLAQVDSDLALARALQEQERAYMMLRMDGGGVDGSAYASSESGSYVYEEEIDGRDRAEEEGEVVVEGSDYGEDVFDPEDLENEEALVRALEAGDEREIAVRLMALELAGLNENDWGVVEMGERSWSSQLDAWQDVDPDELSYEELIALGEVVGTESRGLSADRIASLPSINYKGQDVQDGNSDQCVICRLDYEAGDPLVVLSCKHNYHSECINRWLQINKVCPICSAEVSTSSG
ncbi:E3 ubiquitin ligase BIG BROTHER-related [Iris pallida]|uniref:E3 ubiquitin ligase BIG BROTHER-related n=1 Tax=Iris pallida TaxID=29817 RepID=A0AAX6EU99_IRIPA|nr:E3 ubiquitin ligase BIG BROTHER-related [Iris pallida]